MATYTAIDPQTVSEIVASSGANAQEQLWGAQIIAGAAARNPYSRLIGGVASGRPIKQIADTTKVRGTKIILTVDAPLGGAGKQGSGVTLTGSGESIKYRTYDVTIGALWNGVKWENVAASQTTLGTNLDSRAQAKLKDWWAKRTGYDINAEFKAREHERNVIFGGNKTSIAALRGGDTFVPNVSTRAKDLLGMIRGQPFNVAKKGHQEVKRFFLQGNNRLFADMEASDDWQTILSQSDTRGSENMLWTGILPSYQGTIWDRYELEIDTGDGPQGNFDIPLALSGSAITSANVDDTGLATIDLLGGGSAAAGALTDRLYFQFFANAQYVGCEGEKIAASTSTAKHALVRVMSGANAGKFGLIEYTVNNGNKLVVQKVLSDTTTSGATANQTVGSVTYGSGIWTSSLVTDDFPIGSEILPCNAYGQPYVAGTMLAQDAIVTGYGSVDGQICMARRTQEKQNHGRDQEIGVETVWGSRAMEDANNMVNGYVRIYCAYNPPGFPGTV